MYLRKGRKKSRLWESKKEEGVLSVEGKKLIVNRRERLVSCNKGKWGREVRMKREKGAYAAGKKEAAFSSEEEGGTFQRTKKEERFLSPKKTVRKEGEV